MKLIGMLVRAILMCARALVDVWIVKLIGIVMRGMLVHARILISGMLVTLGIN